MRKIIMFIVCVMLLFSVLSITIFAEDVAETASTEVTVSEEETTVLSRTWEWLVDNKATIFSITGEGALLILMLLSGRKQKGMRIDLSSLKVSGINTAQGQEALTDKFNEIVDAINKNEETQEKLVKAEKHIEDVVDAASEMMVSLFEMMTMIHTQNRNLPQGTKDRVTQIFANCMEKVQGHETLSAISTGLKTSYEAITQAQSVKEKNNVKRNEGANN